MAATKGIRLNTILRQQFEDFCRDHLMDERAVVEAWLLKFLEASDAERREVAKRYGAWISSIPQSDTQADQRKDEGARGRRKK